MLAPSDLGRAFAGADAAFDAAIEVSGSMRTTGPGYKEAEARPEEAGRPSRAIAGRIVRAPAFDENLVDKALVGVSIMTALQDGSWVALKADSHCVYERAIAEVLLAVLQLAGITDGHVERFGRPAVETEAT